MKRKLKSVKPQDYPTGTAEGMWTDWLTVREAAEVLGVTPVRVYQMIRSKKLVSTTKWERVFVSKVQVSMELNFRRTIERIKRKRAMEQEQIGLDGDAA